MTRRLRGAELSTDRRNALADTTFAFPAQRKMPLSDASHVRNALARFAQVTGVSDAEKSAARGRIKAAAKKFGVQVSDDFSEWERYAEPLLVAGPKLEITVPDAFGEVVRLPYVKVGEWNFRDSYGQREITDADLDTIVLNHQRNARRQDLAVCALPLNEEHAELPADADPATYVGQGAVGWIQRLERDGDTVYADVELNRLGEQLVQDDRYRAVSPELLWNWIDPETDEAWGKTAVGLALTTAPRMKGLASQGGPLLAAAEQARARESAPRVLAFAEDQAVHLDGAMEGLSIAYAFPERRRLPLHTPAAVKGSIARFQTVEADEQERDGAWSAIRAAAERHQVPAPESWRTLQAGECARALLAEQTPEEEAAEPALCIYQPPVVPLGCCPGYTRQPQDDNDGDADVCALWRQCNGYIPTAGEAGEAEWATSGMSQRAGYYGERREGRGAAMKPEDEGAKEKITAPAPVKAAEPVTAPPPPADPPKADRQAQPSWADFAELRTMLTASEERSKVLIQAAEARAISAEQRAAGAESQLTAMKAAERLIGVTNRLEEMVRTGRITPATRDKFCEGDNLARMAENEFLLDGLASLPEGHAVPLRELGSGAAETRSEDAKIVAMAEAYRREQHQAGNKVSVKDSILHAARQSTQVGYRG